MTAAVEELPDLIMLDLDLAEEFDDIMTRRIGNSIDLPSIFLLSETQVPLLLRDKRFGKYGYLAELPWKSFLTLSSNGLKHTEELLSQANQPFLKTMPRVFRNILW